MICSTVGLDDREEEWAICFLCHWKRLQTEGHAQNCACNQVGDILCTSQRIDIVPRHACLKCKMVIHYACCKEYRASGNSDTCWKREPICKKCAHVEEKENRVIGRKIPPPKAMVSTPVSPKLPPLKKDTAETQGKKKKTVDMSEIPPDPSFGSVEVVPFLLFGKDNEVYLKYPDPWITAHVLEGVISSDPVVKRWFLWDSLPSKREYMDETREWIKVNAEYVSRLNMKHEDGWLCQDHFNFCSHIMHRYTSQFDKENEIFTC